MLAGRRAALKDIGNRAELRAGCAAANNLGTARDVLKLKPHQDHVGMSPGLLARCHVLD